MSRVAVYKKFSGSTRLVCDGESGNANVISQGDILVTAGHMFYNIDDDGTCPFRGPPRKVSQAGGSKIAVAREPARGKQRRKKEIDDPKTIQPIE